jgi:hypothetical protein
MLMHEWIEPWIVKRLEGVSIGFEDLLNILTLALCPAPPSRSARSPMNTVFWAAALAAAMSDWRPPPEGSTRASRGKAIQDDIGGDLEFIAAVIAGSVWLRPQKAGSVPCNISSPRSPEKSESIRYQVPAGSGRCKFRPSG